MIYQVAKHIPLSSDEFYGIIKISSFHLQKSFLRCLAQFIERSGLDTILVETNIYADHTLTSILKDVQYNRGIRAHKPVYVVLKCLQFAEYIDQNGFTDDGDT